MRYGFIIPGGELRTVLELTRQAEAAGWDGVFTWDGIYIASAGPTYDPWVLLGAMALQTERVRIGAMLTPVSRRRPWKLARETVTVDHLSHGRLVLPVGLGALDDGGFAGVGEPTDRRVRAELLDEGLAILTGLWNGEPFSFQGKHYHVEDLRFEPRPVQTPIPIWVVGAWPRAKSMERALRYDGLLPTKLGDEPVTPDDIRAMKAWVEERRTATTPFDIVWEGETPGDDPARAAEIVAPYVEAGITWWMESRWPAMGTEGAAVVRERILQGPPRVR
jgi:alkanesulfonate monooxygenase SsuD/methylene tetrahydromethanopterin reductase-like flavin-dependent oxidoreductase (luciferase family)